MGNSERVQVRVFPKAAHTARDLLIGIVLGDLVGSPRWVPHGRVVRNGVESATAQWYRTVEVGGADATGKVLGTVAPPDGAVDDSDMEKNTAPYYYLKIGTHSVCSNSSSKAIHAIQTKI